MHMYCIVKECHLTDICPTTRQSKHHETIIVLHYWCTRERNKEKYSENSVVVFVFYGPSTHFSHFGRGQLT